MQLKLFPDPRPLTERLGSTFFRTIPQDPGVYLMRDIGGTVIYLGKARNLRKRLSTYQLANPDRMHRRTLRLVHTAASIEWILCESELAALAREAELLLALKPRFNRAGVWKGESYQFVWRVDESFAQFDVIPKPIAGWNNAPSIGRILLHARAALHRLAWRLTLEGPCSASFPLGWHEDTIPQFRRTGPLTCQPGDILSLTAGMNQISQGDPIPLHDWLVSRLMPPPTLFARENLLLDLKTIVDCTRGSKTHEAQQPTGPEYPLQDS